MKIIEPSVEIIGNVDGRELLKNIESAGRVCYKSENKVNNESYKKFITDMIKRGHESVIEHEKITVKVICDRGVSHEIVRHRLASYSQESTRFCNYANNKFGSEISVIKPIYWKKNSDQYEIWKKTMETIEISYFKLINSGATPEMARAVLPNSLKTEIFITMNFREWRHFFKTRLSKNAHPQMRQIAKKVFLLLKNKINIIFDDIECFDE